MASDFSNYLKNAFYNAALRGVNFTAPTTVYLALFLSDPTASGSGTEVSGGSYARLPLAVTVPSNGSGNNSGTISFGPATADWGTITHSAVYDSLSGGNLLFFDALQAPKIIANGDIAKFDIGGVAINFG